MLTVVVLRIVAALAIANVVNLLLAKRCRSILISPKTKTTTRKIRQRYIGA